MYRHVTSRRDIGVAAPGNLNISTELVRHGASLRGSGFKVGEGEGLREAWAYAQWLIDRITHLRLVRLDAERQLGSGHVRPARTLAAESNGVDDVFLGLEAAGLMIRIDCLVLERGVQPLPAAPPDERCCNATSLAVPLPARAHPRSPSCHHACAGRARWAWAS